ncbi:Transcription factor IIIA [Quaeritorhiza haematococci]|nr:Transcription factor IIIA [Quaeritorhiza haematococci]
MNTLTPPLPKRRGRPKKKTESENALESPLVLNPDPNIEAAASPAEFRQPKTEKPLTVFRRKKVIAEIVEGLVQKLGELLAQQKEELWKKGVIVNEADERWIRDESASRLMVRLKADRVEGNNAAVNSSSATSAVESPLMTEGGSQAGGMAGIQQSSVDVAPESQASLGLEQAQQGGSASAGLVVNDELGEDFDTPVNNEPLNMDVDGEEGVSSTGTLQDPQSPAPPPLLNTGSPIPDDFTASEKLIAYLLDWLVTMPETDTDAPFKHKILSIMLRSFPMQELRTIARRLNLKDINWHPCPYEGCFKIYQHLAYLTRHVRSRHTNERPYKCEHEGCGRSFVTKQKLNLHAILHTDDKPFACRFEGCDRKFQSANSRRHHELTHSSVKPFECPFPGCDRRFYRKDNMNTHFKVHSKTE